MTRRLGTFAVLLVLALLSAGALQPVRSTPALAQIAPVFGFTASAAGRALDAVVVLHRAPLIESYVRLRGRSGRHADVQSQHRTTTAIRSLQGQVMAVAARYGRVTGRLSNLVDGLAVSGLTPGGLAALRTLPQVASIQVMGASHTTLERSVPYVGAQQVLDGPRHLTGAGSTVAVIDTGIDYTHRDFGGPGTPADYTRAKAVAASVPPPDLFPNAKVIGGYDFVGDTWDNKTHKQLEPDANPLDIIGHGTHVSGIIAGFGVPNNSVGGSMPTQFPQPGGTFSVFHGVAPGTRLYAYKVCSSVANECSNLAVVQAIDAAMDPNHTGTMNDHVDVINLSLGDAFTSNEVSTLELDRAAQVGVTASVAAGNGGNHPFTVDSPSGAERVLSVASVWAGGTPAYGTTARAVYGLKSVPDLSKRVPFLWEPWSGPLTSPATGRVVAAGDASVTSQYDPAYPGCSIVPAGHPATAYMPGALTGAIVLVDAGGCSLSDKARTAQNAGAVGAILVAPEGASPDYSTAERGTAITIPAVEIAHPNGAVLRQGAGAGTGPLTVTIGQNVVGDVGDTLSASSSRGPTRRALLKPDLTAPGVAIHSAAAGTGTDGLLESGTSMASPHVAGALALMKSEHPDWSAQELEAVLVNTTHEGVYYLDYLDAQPSTRVPISRAGAGLLNVEAAAGATTVVLGDLLAHLSFGYQTPVGPTTLSDTMTIINRGRTPKTYTFGSSFLGNAAGASIAFSRSSVTIAPKNRATVAVLLTLDPAALSPWSLAGVGRVSPDALTQSEIAGQVYVTDIATSQVYHEPFYTLPRAASAVSASVTPGLGAVTLSNSSGHAGSTQLFSLVSNDVQGDVPAPQGTPTDEFDIQAVGVRRTSDGAVQFAVKTYGVSPNPYDREFDIFVDTNGDGIADYLVFNADAAAMNGANPNGVNDVYVRDLHTNVTAGPESTTAGSVNSSVSILQVPLSALGGPSGPISLCVQSTQGNIEGAGLGFGTLDRAPDVGWTSLNLSQPRYRPQVVDSVVPGEGSASMTVVDSGVSDGELGLLALYFDNVAGSAEAQLLLP